MRNVIALLLFAFITATANAGDWYAGAYGGANWDDVLAHPKVNSNTGIVVGGVVGRTVPAVPGLRIEADISFRQNDVDVGPFGPLTINVDHDTFALLGNLVWDVPVKLGPVQPFVLAGVGYANTEATFENVSLLKLEASGVAFQLGGGLQTQVADGIGLGVSYRYFQGPSLEVLGTELSDGSNHSVVAELKFAL